MRSFTRLCAYATGVGKELKRVASRRFSGKFMVRVPPNVHRELVLEAAEAGVSLNRVATVKLSH